MEIGDLTVDPFSISHDAANPVGYRISHEGHSAAVATDLGVYDTYIINHLQHLDVLLLEANHDVHMLEVGNLSLLSETADSGQPGAPVQ